MNTPPAEVLILSADAQLTKQLVRISGGAEGPAGAHAHLAAVRNLNQARAFLKKEAPAVIVLDDLAVRRAGQSLTRVIREFAGSACVICVASAKRQAELAEVDDLVCEERALIVWRQGNFLPRLTAAVEERLEGITSSLARPETAELSLDFGSPEDFGEVLRHEVNNPLTGILGNAELLLARRESLPTVAVERLETIAELAVRLRETIRRLSRAWESAAADRHVRSA